MTVEQQISLADQMLLNIDTVMSQLMRLREEVKSIKDNCSKLQYQAGVSTPALRNGKDAAIAMVLNNRAKTIAKQINQ
jgi:hypothetical protein